jgi:hypothetical protein
VPIDDQGVVRVKVGSINRLGSHLTEAGAFRDPGTLLRFWRGASRAFRDRYICRLFQVNRYRNLPHSSSAVRDFDLGDCTAGLYGRSRPFLGWILLQKSSECPDTKERFAKLSAGEILFPVRAPVESFIAGTSTLQQFYNAIE